MELKITMNCDNAAFGEGFGNFEVGRILRELAQKIEDLGELTELNSPIPLIDYNGNRVGTADLIEE